MQMAIVIFTAAPNVAADLGPHAVPRQNKIGRAAARCLCQVCCKCVAQFCGVAAGQPANPVAAVCLSYYSLYKHTAPPMPLSKSPSIASSLLPRHCTVKCDDGAMVLYRYTFVHAPLRSPNIFGQARWPFTFFLLSYM